MGGFELQLHNVLGSARNALIMRASHAASAHKVYSVKHAVHHALVARARPILLRGAPAGVGAKKAGENHYRCMYALSAREK